jgi:lipopolysaccharide export LptBFGC system permease protein LptF
LILVFSVPCHASLETSLVNLKVKLMTVILPVLSVMGIAWAALSLFSGNPNAKQHMLYAVMGCAFGFGAQLIVDFLASVVR